MFRANLGQVYRTDHEGRRWDAWVIHIAQAAPTTKDEEIRKHHWQVETSLSAQNVSFVEITTDDGKKGFYKQFGCKSKRHPFFAILSSYPKDHKAGDLFLIIEWGDFPSAAAVAHDLLTLSAFFSDGRFKEILADAATLRDWSRVQAFIDGHDFRGLAVGDNVRVETFVDPEENDGADSGEGATAREP